MVQKSMYIQYESDRVAENHIIFLPMQFHMLKAPITRTRVAKLGQMLVFTAGQAFVLYADGTLMHILIHEKSPILDIG